MSKRVSTHELAEFELNDAADYYESREPDTIRVLAIAPQRRRPLYWRGRR